MRFKLPKTKNLILVIFLMAVSAWIGFGFGAKGFEVQIAKGANVTISRAVPEPDLNFNLFWKVWDVLSSSYFDKSKIVPSKMVYGAIQGMVASLGDPYTMFLQPSQNKITNEDLQGNFGGVGIELGYKNDQLAVMAPLPGTPADKVGVKAGDLIVGIKDPTKNLDITIDGGINLSQAVDDIRGPKGTVVTLTLLRDGNTKPFTVDIVRDIINVPSVKLEYVGDNKNIAHLSILKFGGDTMQEWLKSVDDIVKHTPKVDKVILDLRNNPGGYLQDAVDISGEFLSKGSVAVIQQKADNSKVEMRTEREGQLLNYKVVMLVNGGSASASEILSGALRDNKHVELIGEKTFGKGTIQEPEDLEGGAGIHITIAKWLTPNGTWVHGVGLTPDVAVSLDENTKTDTQLNKAIEVIKGL